MTSGSSTRSPTWAQSSGDEQRAPQSSAKSGGGGDRSRSSSTGDAGRDVRGPAPGGGGSRQGSKCGAPMGSFLREKVTASEGLSPTPSRPPLSGDLTVVGVAGSAPRKAVFYHPKPPELTSVRH